MPQHAHAVVCIDHTQALIVDFSKDASNEQRVAAAGGTGNIHHKAGSPGSGHAQDNKAFFTAVAAALEPAQEILVIGHGTAKTEFSHFIRDHFPDLAPRIMGVETVDHPTNGEILALARKFFDAKDLTTPQIVA